MGSANGLSAVPMAIPFSGVTAAGPFILNVASAGDVNGDGYGDILVSATSVAPPVTVDLYLGGPGGLSAKRIVLANPNGSAFFGTQLAGVGDIDGDGFDDLAIGLGTASLRQAYVYRGGPMGPPPMPSITLSPPASNTGLFGAPLAAVGDVNRDGFADVGVGSAYGSAAYVYLGAASGLATTPWQAFAPPGVMQFGGTMASVKRVRGKRGGG
jgi:hypothetical protein